MCFETQPTISSSWQHGGRADVSRWLNELAACCVASVAGATLIANFLDTGYPNGAPQRCDILYIERNGELWGSLDEGATWFIIYDPNASSGFNPGMILFTASSTIPNGFLVCDGSAVSRSTYSALFTAIGTTYGIGDNSTTFNLPDLRGRTVIGVGTGSGLTARSLADSVGAETHTLNVSELPAHNHSLKWKAAAGTGTVNIQNTAATGTQDSTSAGAMLTTGSDAPHNNMQPSLTLNGIIKY